VAILIAFPILGGLMMFQSAVASRIPLLHGSVDLVLLALVAWALQKRVNTAWHWALIGGLIFSLASALPIGVMLFGYLGTIGLAELLKRRVWHIPILAMFVTVFLGTLITHIFSILALLLTGTPLPWLQTLNLVTLPSLLLNTLLAVPMYAIIGDLAGWLYPQEMEV
jgi:cell shape-determining protein MreD